MTDSIGIATLANQVSSTRAVRTSRRGAEARAQRHKIVAKRGGHFTLMVVGESGLGKVRHAARSTCRRERLTVTRSQTTLINTLFSTELAMPKDYRRRFAKQLDKTTEIGPSRRSAFLSSGTPDPSSAQISSRPSSRKRASGSSSQSSTRPALATTSITATAGRPSSTS